jgi:hypothetical protein
LGVKNRIQKDFFTNQVLANDYSAMMKEELENLAGNRLKALENIEQNKRRIVRWYDKKSKLKNFPKGIWFGNLYYQSALEIQNTDCGHQLWKGHIVLANVC